MSILAFLNADVVEKIVEPILSPIAQTMFGAVCLLCLGVAGVAVWKLLSVQEKAADRAEKHNIRLEALANKMTDAITKFDKTVDKLVEETRRNQEAQKDQSELLGQLKNSFETTIRDAILSTRYRRSYEPGKSEGSE